MKKLLRTHFIFFVFLLIFTLLLFKDPFSERTLIPNFEPFPDAIYYIATAKSLLIGEGLTIGREQRYYPPPIPPLYSLSLAPIFIINKDPRMFYFSNIFMALVSFLFFYKILVLLKINKLIIWFTLFLYITNYFLYWLPTLAMAENLTLLLFLISLFLLLSKINRLNIVIVGLLGIGFYATKYASIPLTAIFLSSYFIRLFLNWRRKKIDIKNILLFIITVLLCSAVFFGFEELTKGTSPIHSLMIFSSSIIKTAATSKETASLASASSTSSSWFSTDYIHINLQHYLNSILGGSERFLWDSTPLIPKFVGIGGILGLFLGLIIKRFRAVSSVLIASLLSSILFMSTLYTFDMRYIYFAIPTLILGFSIFLNIILEKYNKGFLGFCLIIAVLFMFAFYGITNSIRIKNQISLNLRYAETPWYYVSVLKMNDYFTKDKIIQGKKPVVISALPPYFVDLYSNGNYELLPLSYDQEFRNIKEIVWGPNDYSDLPRLYEKYLKEGYDVYLARYGLGNEGYTNRDFQIIMEKFDTHLEVHGCFEQCNIYKINFKKYEKEVTQ